MEESCLLIINPVSGDGIAKRWIFEITKGLSEKYKYITVYYSRGGGDVKKAVIENAHKYSAVIAAGGDGTLTEAATGVYKSGVKIPLGFIPCGTMNDFMTSHKMASTVSDAIYDIVHGEPVEYDMFSIEDEPCVYVSSFASFIDMSYSTSRQSKATFGVLAYITETLKRVPKLKGYKMWFENARGELISGDYIVGFVSNTPNPCGFRLFPDIEMDKRLSDGEVEITLVRYPDNLNEFNVALSALISGANHKFIYRDTIKETVFHFDIDNPLWTLEGEKGPSKKDMSVKVIPKGLSVIKRKADLTDD